MLIYMKGRYIMSDFCIGLNQSNDYIIYLKSHISDFNELSDDDIELLFQDSSINGECKGFILELASERINRLPFHIFIHVISEITNPNVLIEKYGNRIKAMNYDELVTLIYGGIYDVECLLTIVKMDSFQLHLQEEMNHGGNKLQCFLLQSELYLAKDSESKLASIGSEINLLLSKPLDIPKDVDFLVDSYLDKVVGADEKDLNHDIFIQAFSMMCHYIQHHKIISPKMVQFYTSYRIKELGLSSVYEDVVISMDFEPNMFGYVQASEKKIKIYYNYIPNKFGRIFERDNYNNQNDNNDLMNLNIFKMLSHEIGHALDDKKIIDLYANVPATEYTKLLECDPFLSYFYKSAVLYHSVGENKYYVNHDSFIHENRADLFSIIDFSNQISKHFKTAFKETMLQRFVGWNASTIVNLYTEKQGEDGIHIISPMEKFDRFFEQCLPNYADEIQFKKISPPCNTTEEEILHNLLLGNSIPKPILIGLYELSARDNPSIDFCDELHNIISKYVVSISGHERQSVGIHR